MASAKATGAGWVVGSDDSGVQERRKDLYSIDQAGPRAREVGTRVDIKEIARIRKLGTSQQERPFVARCLDVIPAGHEHHDFGSGNGDLFPCDPH